MRKPSKQQIKHGFQVFLAVTVPTLLFSYFFLSRFLFEWTGNAYFIALAISAVPVAFAFMFTVSVKWILKN